MSTLLLAEINATSPSLAEAMRECLLRAGLSKTKGIADYVLGNPKAWLGTAYHYVMEKIADVVVDEAGLESAVEELWQDALGRESQRVSAHRFDRRFGAPTVWPGYYLVRAAASIRARELVAKRPANRSTSREAAAPVTLREEAYTAFGGRLVGKPDVVREDEIIDYKSGAVLDYDESSHAELVKASYIRQLRIYGYLVHARHGRWPKRGILLPLAGGPVEVGLTAVDCEREAVGSVELLDGYNAAVRAGSAVEDLSRASIDSCRWCPYKIACPSFWRVANASWSDALDGAAIQGTVSAPPRNTYGGAAIALTIQVDAGTAPHGTAQVGPIVPEVHPTAGSLAPGDRVRLVGLRVRPDGTLVPTHRTLLTRPENVPGLGSVGAI